MTADRCKETTTTTGVGAITLLGAVAQFQSFATAFGAYPTTVSYAIVGQTGTEWEVGVGTLTDATTLERTTVQDSSNAGAAVNFAAGTKDVFATLTAQDLADITAALSGKAPTVHTHAIADTTGLQTALDGKAATTHTHDIADTTGLQTALDGKASKTTANDFTAAQEISVNGAASTPALKLDGTIFTGGTATTTKPQLLVEPAGTTSAAWSTNGTLIGGNAATGFSGSLIELQVNGTQYFKVSGSGNVTLYNGNIYFGTGQDLILVRDAAATLQMGVDAASPVTQTFKGCDGSGTNVVGGVLNIAAGKGTGTAAGGALNFQTSAPTSSGSSAGTLTTRLAISGTAITASLPLITQGYTVATLPTGVTGMRAHVTDATAPTYLGALTGGGSVVCPVFYNGSAWVSA